jgi:1-acyl-sn-glycerol-3-phosphate acyltransferase
MDTLVRTEPLLIVFNHINFLEVLILITHSYPLYCTGLAKSETWDNPLFSFLFNTYKAIPINRSGAYRDTFIQVRQAIDNGFYVAIAPEGSRSKDGILRKGKAGIIQLALEANSPILPVGHFGGQKIWKNLKHFKRTQFQVKTGQPFRIKYEGRPGRIEREQILDEVMGQIARLLPLEMRGVYTQQAELECKHLEFIEYNNA